MLNVNAVVESAPEEDCPAWCSYPGAAACYRSSIQSSQEIVAKAAPALDEARSVREKFEFVVKHTPGCVASRVVSAADSGPRPLLACHIERAGIGDMCGPHQLQRR